MKWLIPAKTFLVGEYVALHGGPALILTTSPCFEVILSEIPGLHGFHQRSPAGKWWLKQEIHMQGLAWYDPYQCLGGVGASSAQFLGAYVASQYVMTSLSSPISIQELLKAYLQSAWQDGGTRPSGYDVIAQSLQGCALIHHQRKQYVTISWPFQDLAFILLRTGIKIPTHEHLNHLDLKDNLYDLTETAVLACQAFQKGNRFQLIEAVRVYHEQLKKRAWVADHSLQCIEFLQACLKPKPLAIKGCGAFGADVLLILVAAEDLETCKQQLHAADWNILATSQELCYSTSI